MFIQREEQEDYAAEAQFVDEHGHMLTRKVSHLNLHHSQTLIHTQTLQTQADRIFL